MELRTSEDIVLVRQAVRKKAVALGFGLVDQTKVVTASSELARNTIDYGGGGTVQLEVVQNDRRTGLRLVFEDQGPGIPDIESGSYRRLHVREWNGAWAWAEPSASPTNLRSPRSWAKGPEFRS